MKVLRVSPEHFWAFSLAVSVRNIYPQAYDRYYHKLFKRQGEYFDIPTSTLTPLQIRESLANLAAEVIPANKVEEFKELLKLKSSPNGGVAVTDDLKYTSR